MPVALHFFLFFWLNNLTAHSCYLVPSTAVQKADTIGDPTVATINHSPLQLKRLQELLLNGNSSDTTLRVHTAGSDEVKVFHTHQLMLSLHSEIFETLLQNQTVLDLHEPPDNVALFEKFIR